MNESTYTILLPLLKDFAFFTGFGLFLISLVVGLILTLRPDIIVKLNKQVGKRFSFRRMTKFVEIPNNVDRLFYRHHKVIGVVVTLISAYVLYYLAFVYDATIISQILKSSQYALVLDLFVTALRLFMLICSAAIVLLGIAIFFRPSQLKIIETWANRWVSTRQATRQLSVERDEINQLAYKYPRFVGLLITFLSLYASILLFLVYTE